MDSMEKSNKKPNYYEKLSVVISQIVPKYLRQFFIERWNAKFPEQSWKSCSESGTDLVNAIPDKKKTKKNRKKFNEFKDMLNYGKEEEWGTDILAHIMVDFGLDICDKSVKGDIVKLRRACSQFASYTPSNPCLPEHSDKMIADITNAARKLFQKDADDEICKIWQSDIETSKSDEQCIQPNKEMKCSKELGKGEENESKHLSGKLLFQLFYATIFLLC